MSARCLLMVSYTVFLFIYLFIYLIFLPFHCYIPLIGKNTLEFNTIVLNITTQKQFKFKKVMHKYLDVVVCYQHSFVGCFSMHVHFGSLALCDHHNGCFFFFYIYILHINKTNGGNGLY